MHWRIQIWIKNNSVVDPDLELFGQVGSGKIASDPDSKSDLALYNLSEFFIKMVPLVFDYTNISLGSPKNAYKDFSAVPLQYT